MSSDRISDVSSVISADWQSDDEPHTDAVGDLIPLVVHRSKVVLAYQILCLGTAVEDLDDLATVTVRILPLSDVSQSVAVASASWLRELGGVTPVHTTLRELTKNHPEVAEAVRFMAIGTVGVLHKKLDWIMPVDKSDFFSLESKRLQQYRTRFARLQGDKSTKDAVRQFMARGVKPFMVISLDSAHARQRILNTNALTTVVRKTKIWQIADEKSIVKWRIWPADAEAVITYEMLSVAPYVEYSTPIQQISSPSLRYLALHMALGEVLKVEWNDERPPIVETNTTLLQLIQFDNVEVFNCLSDRVAHARELSDCLQDSEVITKDSENVCQMRTILNIECEDNWERMRATGIRPIESGALTVVKIGDDYLAFVMKRTRVLPLWFQSIIAKMKCNYQYTLKLSNDMHLVHDDANISGFMIEHKFNDLRRRIKDLRDCGTIRSQAACADESTTEQRVDDWNLTDSAFEPIHKSFASSASNALLNIRLDRVYKLDMPQSLAEFNEKCSIDHFVQIPNDYCIQANRSYDVICLGEISNELNGNSADLTKCIINCVSLITQAELQYAARPALFATLSTSAELYVHSVLSRILEPHEFTDLQIFCYESGIQELFPPVLPELIPKIELLAPNLHKIFMSIIHYFNGLRYKLYYDKKSDRNERNAIINNFISAREMATSLQPGIEQNCHEYITEVLFGAEEYEKCLEYCAKWQHACPKLRTTAQEAQKHHAAGEAKARTMYRKMFQ